MSLERHKGLKYCTCDSCGDELKDEKGHTFMFDTDEFDVFRERLNAEGWSAIKNHGTWEHVCPSCKA